MVRLLPPKTHTNHSKTKGFNPTMVRLLPAEELMPRLVTAMFQSHNGAIAAKGEQVHAKCHSYVSIPQWCDCCIHESSLLTAGSFEFQSHNGAIAAWRSVKMSVSLVRFQSHNGAIAASINKNGNALQWGFNPTMVRLLHRIQRKPKGMGRSFNPTMVRLLPRQNFGI